VSWPLPAQNAPEGPAVYGIRPEHFRLAGDGMQARVVIVEPMGSETQVTMKIGETAVNGVFRERITARPGDILPVAPQAAMAHLFSKATSERL
jgi:multiple sugar transport system ATP-binding protein